MLPNQQHKSGYELTYSPEMKEKYSEQYRGMSPSSGQTRVAYPIREVFQRPGAEQAKALNVQGAGIQTKGGDFFAEGDASPSSQLPVTSKSASPTPIVSPDHITDVGALPGMNVSATPGVNADVTQQPDQNLAGQLPAGNDFNTANTKDYIDRSGYISDDDPRMQKRRAEAQAVQAGRKQYIKNSATGMYDLGGNVRGKQSLGAQRLAFDQEKLAGQTGLDQQRIDQTGDIAKQAQMNRSAELDSKIENKLGSIFNNPEFGQISFDIENEKDPVNKQKLMDAFLQRFGLGYDKMGQYIQSKTAPKQDGLSQLMSQLPNAQ